MPKTAVILLNYNDGAAAVKAAERIRAFKNIDAIILADNASTDDSAEVLRAYTGDCPPSLLFGEGGTVPEFLSGEDGTVPVKLLLNPRNGGYGYGNNRGVEEAVKRGCDYALIANPDAVFTEETVEKLKGALQNGNAAAGALMEGKKKTDCAWPLLSFAGELAFAGPLTKRIFRKKVLYPEEYFASLPREAGAVHGSLFLVRTEDFVKAGGFDEEMFLFCEEKTLGKRLEAIGKKIVLTDAVYGHAGSETLKKTGMSAVKRQKARQKSERIYYRKYLGAGPVRMFAVSIEQLAVLLETMIAGGK